MRDRKDYMTATQKKQMEGIKHRTHQNCKDATGVMRPGKTAKDRANGHGR